MVIKKEQSLNIDVAKWISALCMIVIHSHPFSLYSELGDFLLSGVITPVAISLFFVFSGFFLGKKLPVKDGKVPLEKDDCKWLAKYQVKNVLIYGIATLVYFLWQLPRWHAAGWWGVAMIKDFAISMLFKGSYYHLWYLLALLYAVPVLCFLINRFHRIQIIGLCVVGWLLECAINSYSWLFVPILSIAPIRTMLGVFSAVMAAMFRAIPLLYLGVCLARGVNERTAEVWSVRCAGAFVAWAVEIIALSRLDGMDGAYAYVLSTPVVVYCVMQWLLQLKKPLFPIAFGTTLRKSSILIYLFHPILIDMYSMSGLPDGGLCWLVVTAVSVGLTIVIFKQEKHRAQSSCE